MVAAYAVRRLMALFATYEAFPYNPEFVRLAVLPSIASELISGLQNLLMFNPPEGIYQFKSLAEHAFHDAVFMRQISAVRDLKIVIPSRENKATCISITWTIFFHPTLKTHGIEIPMQPYMDQRQCDNLVEKAQSRIVRLTELLAEEEKLEPKYGILK